MFNYLKDVVIPSLTAYHLDKNKKLTYDYHTAPWEAEADKHGDVTSRSPDSTLPPWNEKDNGYYHLDDLWRAILNQ